MTYVLRLASEDAVGALAAGILAAIYDPAATPLMRRLAQLIEGGAESERDRLQRLFNWVRERMAYRRDPHEREFFELPATHARRALDGQWTGGDCDDHTALIGALAAASGFRVRIVFTQQAGSGPRPVWDWDHIHAEALSDKKHWVPLDTSLKRLDFGERAPGQARTCAYPEDLPSSVLFGGGGGVGFITAAIQTGGQLASQAITSRAVKAVADQQKALQTLVVGAQERLAGRQLELEAASAELEAERAARVEAERSAISQWSSRWGAANTTSKASWAVTMAAVAIAIWIWGRGAP